MLITPGAVRSRARVRGRDVPEWAAEFGADTWGKFFIKFVISHPAITCVTPATSKARNMLDNIGAAFGELPDEATRQRGGSAQALQEVERRPLAGKQQGSATAQRGQVNYFRQVASYNVQGGIAEIVSASPEGRTTRAPGDRS